MNPSWRIDELARRVLQAARWPGAISCVGTSEAAASGNNSPTPHLDELERSLEIRLPPLVSPVDDYATVSGIRTCTVPNDSEVSAVSSSNNTNNNSEVWTWTPHANSTDNSYSKQKAVKSALASSGNEIVLEELAPFPPDFYRAMGELVREAFHPECVKDLELTQSIHKDAKNTTGCTSEQDSTNMIIYKSLLSLEQYSLPRMQNAVRITRILLSLQELHVGSSEVDNGVDDASFLERLLHYCEGNSMEIKLIKAKSCANSSQVKVAPNSGKRKRIPILSSLFHHWGSLPQLEHGLQQLSRRYTSLLPMNATEYREYCEYCSIMGNSNSDVSATSGSIGDGGSTGGEWENSSSSSSFLGARALKIDSFKMRLEDELKCHVSGGSSDSDKLNQDKPEQGGLVALLSLIYQTSDAALRGKCRRWIGQWLRSHALGSGSSVSYATIGGIGGDGRSSAVDSGLGPSLASFCPLIVALSFGSNTSSSGARGGGTMTSGVGPISITHMGDGGGGKGAIQHNPLGMENTSACGIEALLEVLLRIILGFHPSNADDDTTSANHADGGQSRRSTMLRPSHESLLFDVLLPLHRPAGMVLWRDQTPLIGLYHEALVKCIGAFIAMDRGLVGPIVGALLHPDIWPSEGGARGTALGGNGAVVGASANTPKVVLLLHEVDTLIGLLLPSIKDGDHSQCLSSFDPFVLPLSLRLCACISSYNSRTSERSLQFFRNKAFQLMVQHRLDEVGPLFIRALCRCSGSGSSLSDGFEVPWNPTVKKMTLLVLSELEGYYIEKKGDDAFDAACEEALCDCLSDGTSLSKAESTATKGTRGSATVGYRPDVVVTTDTSLKSAMGTWRPPPTQKSRTKPPGQALSLQPPSTVTGVAPWAMGSGQGHGMRQQSKSMMQPPLTVTGIAPWAMQAQTQSKIPLISSRGSSFGIPRPAKTKNVSEESLSSSSNRSVDVRIVEEAEDSGDVEMEDHDSGIASPALRKVRSYMERLKPANEGEKPSDGISTWAKAQMYESPVLLPNLKFHDLVFGQELGTGV